MLDTNANMYVTFRVFDEGMPNKLLTEFSNKTDNSVKTESGCMIHRLHMHQSAAASISRANHWCKELAAVGTEENDAFCVEVKHLGHFLTTHIHVYTVYRHTLPHGKGLSFIITEIPTTGIKTKFPRSFADKEMSRTWQISWRG